MLMTPEILPFNERYHVGDKICIKSYEQLDVDDQHNVSIGNPGKERYLGKILTVIEVHYEKEFRSFCLAEEDDESYCWFDSFILQTIHSLPARKNNTLPSI